jgi:nucleotide-binding universal stress UspA family protein
MGTFSEIVVAFDGSGPSQRASAFAIALAAREGAHLAFCSAVSPVTSYVAAIEGSPADLKSARRALEEDARGHCLEAMSRAAAQGVDASSVVLDGDPAGEILRLAQSLCATAIVVGTHGRRGIARAVLGSVAVAIVRGARVPVFVVGPQAAIDRDGPILVAVDASPAARDAVRIAGDLAVSQRTSLQVVHVFDDRDVNRIPDRPGYDPDVARREAMTLASDELEDVTDGLRKENIAFASEMCEGDPVAEIVAAAARVNARFIVTGTHGGDALDRLFFGSVAEPLLRVAPVPVMTLR